MYELYFCQKLKKLNIIRYLLLLYLKYLKFFKMIMYFWIFKGDLVNGAVQMPGDVSLKVAWYWNVIMTLSIVLFKTKNI